MVGSLTLGMMACSGQRAQVAPSATTPQAASVVTTPNEADIPKPVPGSFGLAGQARPDISRFLQVRIAGAPVLSPDGRMLAFRTDISGKPQLWTMATEGGSGWPTQLTFGQSVVFHDWSPTGEWIIYGSDNDGNERVGFYLITPDGNRERELLPPSDAFRLFGGFSPDGKQIAYTIAEGEGFGIRVVDVATGVEREVLRTKSGTYVTAWRPDGAALVLSEVRGEDGNNVYLLTLDNGNVEELFRPEEGARFADVAWRPDSGGFYVASDMDRDFSGLAFYDSGNARLNWIDTPDKDVDRVSLSTDGRYLAWTTNESGSSVLHVRDLKGDRDLTVPEDLPSLIYQMRWAENKAMLAIGGTGPEVPGDIWVWDIESGAGQAVRATTSATAGLNMAEMVTPKHYAFEARDGVTLYGFLYLPRNAAKPGSKPPVLLSVHGGPTAQARPRFNAVHQYLLARGIAVFDFNFRGSTGYGKTFARLDNKRLRPNAVLDLADAIAWLGKQGWVDTERAAIMGGSYGGYLTNAALVTFPEMFRCGVSFVGVSNWITALEGASPQLKATDREEYGDIDDPDDRAFFREISPLTHVDNIRSPIMVIHGANDPRDPVGESDQFVQAIRENGGEVEYLRFPDEGHGVRKLPNRIITYRRVASFLENHLGLKE